MKKAMPAGRRGFTLLEVLIYTAILVFISVFLVNSILMMAKSFNRYRLSRYLNVSAGNAMERMTREIRLANNVGETSIFDVHPGHLILDTVEFFASSTQLMLKKGVQDAVSLTPPGMELTSLIFREVATSTNPNSMAVRLELELKGGQGAYQKSVKFYSTVILRGSY